MSIEAGNNTRSDSVSGEKKRRRSSRKKKGGELSARAISSQRIAEAKRNGEKRYQSANLCTTCKVTDIKYVSTRGCVHCSGTKLARKKEEAWRNSMSSAEYHLIYTLPKGNTYLNGVLSL